MSTILRSLKLMVGADFSQAQKGFAQASKDLKSIGKDFSKTGDTLTKGLTLPIVGAVAGLGALVMKSSSTADEIQRLSDVTGLSAERLQELKYAGSNLGVELETITGAQAKLTKAMFAAQDGTGTQAEAFKKLGIAVNDGSGQMRDAKAIMEEAFTALNGVGNETERDALAMQLFGKSAMDLNPLIKAGGDELNRLATEAQNSGAIMSGETVSALDAFGDSMDAMKLSIGGAAAEVAMSLMPVLDKLLPIVKENVVPAIKGFADIVSGMIDSFNNLSPGMQGFILTMMGMAVAIGPALSVTGSLVTTFGGVVGNVGKAVKIFSSDGGFISVLSALIGPAGIALAAIAAIAGIAYLIIKNWEPIENFFRETWDKIKTTTSSAISFFKELPGEMFDIGKNIVLGLWEGIGSLADWIRSKVGGFVKGIGSTIKDFFGISSPSKLMFGYGEYIGQGLANGINDSKNLVNSAMSGLSTDAIVNASIVAAPMATTSAGSTRKDVIINFNGPVYGQIDFEQKVKQIVRDAGASGAFRGVFANG